MNFLSFDIERKFESDRKLCPGEYDYDNEILPIISERARFRTLLDLIERMETMVNDDIFSEKYTHHYFIHSSTLNDGLVAAIALCTMVYRKYTFSIGDYIVEPRTAPPPKRMLIPGIMSDPFISICEGIPEDITVAADEQEQDDNNACIFIYGSTDPEQIFRFDQEGIKICFVIYSEDRISESRNELPFLKMQSTKNILPPKTAAEQLHYTYIDIPEEQADDLAVYITDQIQKSGLSAEKVKKQIIRLAEHPDIKDEYTAVAAAKSIINTHITNFGSMPVLMPIDFSNYLGRQAVAARKSSDKKPFDLVGLEKEREIINGVVNSIQFDLDRKRMGLSDELSGCNMIFTGQPGTAKTTMARFFASELAERGIIPGPENFRECRKSDIIGQYVGHTAKMIDDMFSSLSHSGGGMIFFDEIYTLSEKNNTCFDIEAINCITQNMENYRSDVYCVFAGYENKMTDFLNSNPGISSRISTYVKFAPYDDDTLYRIFKNIVSAGNFTIKGGCDDILTEFFRKLRRIRGENFGNGREARNLFENVKRLAADRVSSQNKRTKAMLSTLYTEDIEKAAEAILASMITESSRKMRTIGF